MNWVGSRFCVKPSRYKDGVPLRSFLFKGLTILLTIALFCTGVLNANDGDEFLKKGDYDKAIHAYELQVKQGFLGHELFFNLATAYQKKGNISLAILNFEKALRLKPLDKLTHQQLLQLNLQLQDKPVIYQDTGLIALFKKLQFSLGIDTWALLSLLFMMMVPVVIFVSYKYKTIKFRRIIFSSSLIWFLLSGFCVLMARNNYHFKFLHAEAVVMEESVIVYDASNPSSKIKFNVHQGTKLEVLDSTDAMYKISFSGDKGWILRSGIKRIEL